MNNMLIIEEMRNKRKNKENKNLQRPVTSKIDHLVSILLFLLCISMFYNKCNFINIKKLFEMLLIGGILKKDA